MIYKSTVDCPEILSFHDHFSTAVLRFSHDQSARRVFLRSVRKSCNRFLRGPHWIKHSNYGLVSPWKLSPRATLSVLLLRTTQVCKLHSISFPEPPQPIPKPTSETLASLWSTLEKPQRHCVIIREKTRINVLHLHEASPFQLRADKLLVPDIPVPLSERRHFVCSTRRTVPNLLMYAWFKFEWTMVFINAISGATRAATAGWRLVDVRRWRPTSTAARRSAGQST